MENKSDNNTPVETPPETELSSDDDSLEQANAGPGPSPPSGNKGPSPSRRLRSLFGRHNVYLLVFLLLIAVAIIAIFVTIKIGRNDNPKTKTNSLTGQQLAELKGSTAVVGDSSQILQIQSNSIFEGQVLMRNNLDVAGSLKVGGQLSLASVSVGGTSTLGQVAVNGTLAVAGATTLQKGLSVAGPVSFAGSVSVGQLNVTTLLLTGDLTINRHIALSGGIPSKANGSALGGGGTVSINGSDTAGTVTINTGGAPPAGCFGSFSFAQKFNTTPHVVVSPSNSSASTLDFYTNRSNTSFSLCTTSAPTASTTYLFDYVIFD